MERDDDAVQPSAIEAAGETWANLILQARGDLDATIPAGGPLGAPPVGAAALGQSQAPTTRTWGEEIPPPPQPPLPPDLPTEQEAKEEICTNELKYGRKTDQPIFQKMSPKLLEEERGVTMHATQAEWIVDLRSAMRYLIEFEELDDVASLMSDPPCAAPEVYVDLLLKFQDLAAEHSGRPTGAPMLRQWVEALGGQWQYAEPAINPSPTWSEVIKSSKHFEVPYRCAVKSDPTLNLGELPLGEVQGDTMMQLKPQSKKHDTKCVTPGAAFRSLQKDALCRSLSPSTMEHDAMI